MSTLAAAENVQVVIRMRFVSYMLSISPLTLRQSPNIQTLTSHLPPFPIFFTTSTTQAKIKPGTSATINYLSSK
jgi:hypothetical protein